MELGQPAFEGDDARATRAGGEGRQHDLRRDHLADRRVAGARPGDQLHPQRARPAGRKPYGAAAREDAVAVEEDADGERSGPGGHEARAQRQVSSRRLQCPATAPGSSGGGARGVRSTALRRNGAWYGPGRRRSSRARKRPFAPTRAEVTYVRAAVDLDAAAPDRRSQRPGQDGGLSVAGARRRSQA